MANGDRRSGREAARERRREAEAERARKERRTQVMTYGAMAAVVAVLAVLVLIAVSRSGDSGGDTSVDGADEVSTLFDSIPQQGTVLGKPGSKVKIVEFGDLQCPVCRQFAATELPKIVDQQVKTNKASLEFRNWIIIGPQSIPAAKAALAASEQNRYWQYVDLFYKNQGTENSGYVTDDFMTSIAKGAKVPDLEAWKKARGDAKWEKEFKAAEKEAKKQGFQGTPSLLVKGPKGERAVTQATAQAVAQAIDDVQ